MPPFDKDILDTLTDEERAALTDGDPADEPAAAAAAVADAAEGAAGADNDDDADDDAAAAAAAPPIEGKGAAPDAEDPPKSKEPAPAAASAPAAEPAKAPAPAPAAPEPAPYTFTLPADFQQKVGAVKEKEAGLWARFDSGEISREELQRETQALADERQQLQNMQIKAEMSADMRRQQIEQSRDRSVSALFERAAKPESGGIDYRTDKTKIAQLDSFLKALAADDANADKPLDWFLDEAHKRVLVLNGVAPTPQPKADPAAQALARRKPDTTGLDATLAHVPGGQGSGDVGGEFDDILSLEGDAFEDAIAEMSRKQPQRFARFQSSTRL